MALFDLLVSRSRAHGAPPTQVLCLVLTDRVIKAGLIDLVSSPKLVLTTELFPSVDNGTKFSVLIDNCLQALGQPAEAIDQALFCLDESWADAYDVLPEKKQVVELMLKELGLVAVGFIGLKLGLTEAILTQQPSLEFLNLTLSQQALELEYFSGGESQGKTVGARTDTLAFDLDQLVKKATPFLPKQEALSYQVCLINKDESISVSQELKGLCQNYSWPNLPNSPLVDEFSYGELLDQAMLYTAKTWFGKQQFVTKPQPKIIAQENIFQDQSWKKPVKFGFWPQAILGFFFGLVALILIGWIYLTQTSSVTVLIKPASKTISKQVTADLGTVKSSKAQYFLPTKQVEKELTLTGSKTATGTDTVGKKAQGKVQIFNKTGQAKTFSAGTQLHTSSGIDFILDQETLVPAAKTTPNSSGTGETVEYGSLEATVTADKIGDSGNLPTATELTVGVFDRNSYLAKTFDGFTGGESQQITVVSQEDVDSVTRDLKNQAIKLAQEEWEKETNQGTYVTPATRSALLKVQSKPEVGEKADQLNVTAVFKLTALAYTSQDVNQLATQVLQDLIPAGFVLSSAQPHTLSKYPTLSERPSVELEVSSLVLAQVDENKLLEQVAGKSVTEVQSIFASRSDIESYELQFEPRLAHLFLKTLPKSNQVKINVWHE